MALSKKYYEAVAEIISRKAENGQLPWEVGDIVEGLCAYFEDDNPNFDEHRFRDACYGKR